MGIRKIKMAMGFVLYNPTELNKNNIERYIASENFDSYFIFDNSQKENCLHYNKRIVYQWDGSNKGLSIPYNWMIEKCICEDIEYLCLMDQDSDYPLEELERLQTFICTNGKCREYAIIGPRSYLPNSPQKNRVEKISDAKYIINSGSFLNIALFKKYNLRYDLNIFLDGVDYEMGIQLHKCNLKVGIYEDSVFVQNIGYLSSPNDRFVKHAPIRYKYIARNRKYIYKKHYGKIKGPVIAFIKNARLILLILIYEDCKRRKIRAVLSELI